MISNPPKDDGRVYSHISIAWPTEILYENGTIAGFLMPRINQSPDIFEVFHPTVRQKKYPQITWRDLHRISRNLASVFNNIHNAGHVIGDVNQKNILVTAQSLITFVDTDSFQVKDSYGNVYRCPVGVQEYTAPEMQGIKLATVDRNPQQDRFGLAVLIFQLLMDGFHPFTGIPKNNASVMQTELIRQGAFAYYANKFQTPSHNSPAFSILHPDIQALFIKCFIDGHRNPAYRPSAYDWQIALGNAEKNLIRCSQGHWYSNHLSKCPKCPQSGHTTQIGKAIKFSVQNFLKRFFPIIIGVVLFICLGGFIMVSGATLAFMSNGSSNNNPIVYEQPYEQPTDSIFPTEYIPPTDEYVEPTSPPNGSSPSSCPGAPPQRVVVGDKAYVCTQYDRLIVRKGPSRSESEITRIVTGTNFLIVKGPVCADNWSWWRIRTNDGVVGWVSEGGDGTDSYFFCPR